MNICVYIPYTYGKGLKLREFDDGSLQDIKFCHERIYTYICICIYEYICVHI